MGTQPDVKAIKELYEYTLGGPKSEEEIRNKYGLTARKAIHFMEKKATERCGAVHQRTNHKCTRIQGHAVTELHEAHHEPGIAAHPAWFSPEQEAKVVRERLRSYHRNGYSASRVAVSFELWHGLYGSIGQCTSRAKSGGMRCSFYVGHPGLHQALWDQYIAMGEPWETPADAVKDPAVKEPAPASTWAPFADLYGTHHPPVYADHLGSAHLWCNEKASPNHTFTCSRPSGHSGLHEACYAEGKYACGPTWGTDVPKKEAPKEKWAAYKYNTQLRSSPVFSYFKHEKCATSAPNSQGYICTREKGHDGPHEAHIMSGKQTCGPTWEDVKEPSSPMYTLDGKQP